MLSPYMIFLMIILMSISIYVFKIMTNITNKFIDKNKEKIISKETK